MHPYIKNHTVQSTNCYLFNNNMKHGSTAEISSINLKTLYCASTVYALWSRECVETFRQMGGGQVLQKGVSLRLLFTEQNHNLASQYVNAIQAGLHTPSSHNMC